MLWVAANQGRQRRLRLIQAGEPLWFYVVFDTNCQQANLRQQQETRVSYPSVLYAQPQGSDEPEQG
jgi:hypothetical protein